MSAIRRLSPEGVPRALEKAERYRLLNEPEDAESIYRDVLIVEPDNQEALAAMILALTDQFAHGLQGRFNEAWDIAARLSDPYENAYHRGIICERRAKFHHRRGTPAAGNLAHQWLLDAMGAYETAESIHPEGNDDALLRWNTCARMIQHNADIQPADVSTSPLELE